MVNVCVGLRVETRPNAGQLTPACRTGRKYPGTSEVCFLKNCFDLFEKHCIIKTGYLYRKVNAFILSKTWIRMCYETYYSSERSSCRV